MARPVVRNAVVLSILGAVVALVLRSLRSAPLPATSTPKGASAPSTTLAPATDRPTTTGPADREPTVDGSAPAPIAEPLAGADGDADGGDAPDWIDATDEEPPTTHPVKAKLGSGIYHLPGGLNYDRTNADRWYRSAEAAEADGLRPAKR